MALFVQKITDLKYELPKERGAWESPQYIAPPLDALEQFVKLVPETLRVGSFAYTAPPPVELEVLLQLLKKQEVSVR